MRRFLISIYISKLGHPNFFFKMLCLFSEKFASIKSLDMAVKYKSVDKFSLFLESVSKIGSFSLEYVQKFKNGWLLLRQDSEKQNEA